MKIFKKAVPVWCASADHGYNQFAGFYTQLENRESLHAVISIAARSYYRLYINGKMAGHGPARTAKGYCRVDKIQTVLPSHAYVAIEAAAYDKPGKYSNDCTLEPGLLTAEITDGEGNVLSTTGEDSWKCLALKYRRPDVETMSHSRGIVEYYDLTPESESWKKKDTREGEIPVRVNEDVQFLSRRSPLPDLRPIPMQNFAGIHDMVSEGEAKAGYVLTLARMFNQDWYTTIPEKNLFLESLRAEKERKFTGKYRRTPDISAIPGKAPVSLMWSLPASELGFTDFSIHVEEESVIDLINSDHRSLQGEVRANTYVTRWHLQPGTYHLTTFEPKLVRYLRMIVRTKGRFTVSTPQLLNYTYPDTHRTYFDCSDGDLNRIWEGASRTLRLNTLDIFMDCPQRERGGWLCDSNFTARAAWQLYGNACVEKDFIENFMLTDGDEMWHGFFPEVYPGSKKEKGDTGFQSWSFWLAHELYEYWKRTGDEVFVRSCRGRITKFMEGILALKGESGLIEGLDNLFVDWSMSNRSYALTPISVPVNCLISLVLGEMGELYDRQDWKDEAASLRKVLEELDEEPGIFGGGGDAAEYRDGKLRRLDCATESGAALELYSGFHKEDRNYVKKFIYTMGYSPAYRSNPNIGKSNLFIGLMIRFSVLEQLGRTKELVRELKDIYLPELRDGSGTFFENYNGMSGCHGFNGAAAAMLTNDVLGLGAPSLSDHTIRIAPAPGDLCWAAGSAVCGEDEFFMEWSHDADAYRLDIQLTVPEDWTPVYDFPKELHGYRIFINGKECGRED